LIFIKRKIFSWRSIHGRRFAKSKADICRVENSGEMQLTEEGMK